MPEARDRIERPVDYSAAFLNRRPNGVLLDEPATQLNLFGTPVQRLPSRHMMGRGGLLRGNFGIRRSGGRRGQTQFRSLRGRANMSLGVARLARRGRGRTSVSVLPSWYPRTRPWPPSTAIVHQMLLDITSENTGEEDALTPQKKLLNSIDKVEKVVMEEIQKMKNTRCAKRAQREKKVRMLMSMR